MQRQASTRGTCLTRGRLALRCSVRCCYRGSPSVAGSELTTRSTDYTAPRADSHPTPPAFTLEGNTPRMLQRSFVVTGCVCLHALSSFQRTDVRDARGASPCTFRPLHRPCLGEPSKVTKAGLLCQSPVPLTAISR